MGWNAIVCWFGSAAFECGGLVWHGFGFLGFGDSGFGGGFG